jgi:tRNA A37 threonylcarbamoyladenosine modification protein TsaB
LGAKLVAVPTLSVLARNALGAASLAERSGTEAGRYGGNPPPEHVAVLLDAKRGQAFAACFALRDGAYATVVEACLEEPRSFLARCPRPLAVLGEGLAVHQDAAAESGAAVLPPELWPGRAEHVYALGIEQARADKYTPAGDLVPLYVRRPEMEERWEKRQTQSQP